MLRTRSTTHTRWTMSRPLRMGTGLTKNENLIAKSKINISELPETEKLSTGVAIGRYHASKMHKLLHLPKNSHDPSVFYKVGDNLPSR